LFIFKYHHYFLCLSLPTPCQPPFERTLEATKVICCFWKQIHLGHVSIRLVIPTEAKKCSLMYWM